MPIWTRNGRASTKQFFRQKFTEQIGTNGYWTLTVRSYWRVSTETFTETYTGISLANGCVFSGAPGGWIPRTAPCDRVVRERPTNTRHRCRGFYRTLRIPSRYRGSLREGYFRTHRISSTPSGAKRPFPAWKPSLRTTRRCGSSVPHRHILKLAISLHRARMDRFDSYKNEFDEGLKMAPQSTSNATIILCIR